MIARRLMALGVALFAGSAFAGAPAGEPVRPVLPYAGHLDNDGAPFDGLLQMRFSLFTAENGPDPAVFEEVQPSVAVHAGNFAVRIGDPDGQQADAGALAAVLEQDRQYWLEVAVRPVPGPGEDPPWVTLRHRQAIHPATQALWTRKGTNLTADSLTLTGGLTAASVDAPDVSTRRLAVQDTLTFSGQVPYVTVPNAPPGTGVELAAPLLVDGSIRTARVNGSHADVDVGANLTVTGNTTLHGNTTIDMFTVARQGSVNGGAQEHCVAAPAEAQNMCFLVGMQGAANSSPYCYWDPQFGFCAQNATCYFACLRIRP
jgi:hypothetical protein